MLGRPGNYATQDNSRQVQLVFLSVILFTIHYSLISILMSQTKTVSIYSTPTCHFCHATKEFFDEKGVTYTDYNVAENIEKRNEMMQKTGQLGVPVISIMDPSVPEGQTGHEDIVIGFDEGRLRQLLEIA